MKPITEAGDIGLFSLGGLVLFGVSVQWWLAALAILYGVVRLAAVSLNLYWQWKDRKNERKVHSPAGGDGGPAR